MTRTNSIPPLMTFLSTHSFRLGVFLLTAVALVAVPCPAADKRPNILFIIADDQSPFDLNIYNPDSSLETPNLDALAVRQVCCQLFHLRHAARAKDDLDIG